MASIRDLKKDVDYIIYELISDCLAFGEIHDLDESGELSSIISDAVQLRNGLISRINNPENGADSKAVRESFRQIKKDLFTGTDELFEKLSTLAVRGK